MSQDTNIKKTSNQVPWPTEDWFNTRMNGAEYKIVKAYIDEWASAELRKPKQQSALYLLLSLCIKRLSDTYDKRWAHMSAAKLD